MGTHHTAALMRLLYLLWDVLLGIGLGRLIGWAAKWRNRSIWQRAIFVET
jgi:NhaP-type Na+/H+ or K+/H+ antiporter